MVQMTEFRVVMPLSLEEYRVAQMYMVTTMQQQNTSGDEGVEVLENKPFENEELGKGQYTFKVYHLQSKIPTWLTALAPASSLLVEEEAWNAFPKCKTVLKCPYFTRLKLTIETIHVADNGVSSNVHKLDEEALALRKVEMLDISSNIRDYWSYMLGGSMFDLTTFRSKRTGRGPLTVGWQDKCNPVMTAYKLVTVDAQYWGFGYRMEQAFLGAERALFMESHKCCFAWIDEWFQLSIDDVRQMEVESDVRLNMTLHHHSAISRVPNQDGGLLITENSTAALEESFEMLDKSLTMDKSLTIDNGGQDFEAPGTQDNEHNKHAQLECEEQTKELCSNVVVVNI